MAIVVYKCDVCKREVELQRNIAGLERVHRCTITLGCRGKLYQIKNLPDYIRESIPVEVSGLDDWQPRRALYNHTQTIARDSWVIAHNLGTNPAVSVFVNRPLQDNPTNQEEITPTDVVVVDKNTIRLVFDRAWSGVAQLVARQTDPALLHPITTEVTTATETYQRLTKNGEITIATSNSAWFGNPTNLDVTVRFTNALGVAYNKVFTVDNHPSINSPWLDFDQVVVKGKVYKIRSFNLIVPEILSGEIGSGSTVEILQVAASGSPVTAQDIGPGEVLLLLTSAPYDTFDKITTKYIDVATTTANSIFYDTLEFYSITSTIQTTYPPIRSV